MTAKEKDLLVEILSRETKPKPEPDNSGGGWVDRWLISFQFDFYVNLVIVALLGIFCYSFPSAVVHMFPEMPVTFGESIMIIGIASMKFFFARIVLDISLFISENTLYKYYRSNPENEGMSFHEHVQLLTPQNQVWLAFVKVSFYSFLFVWLVTG
jgi:hypothetical protein